MSTEPGRYAEPEPEWRRDYTRDEPYHSRPQRLTPSRDLGPDWEVAEGPDLVGWDLLDPSGNRIGAIRDVLVDTDTGEAVFAIVGIGGAAERKHTLVPVGLLGLQLRDRQAAAPLSEEALMSAPEYTEQTVDAMPFYDFWDRWSAEGRPLGKPGTYEVHEEVHEVQATPEGEVKEVHDETETPPAKPGEPTGPQRIRRVYRHVDRKDRPS